MRQLFKKEKNCIVFVQAVLYLHYKDIDDVDPVDLCEDESLESAGLVVLHDEITPAKSTTSLLRRLMEANLLKTETAVLVLYSGRALLTWEQGPREIEMSGTVRQGLQVIVCVDLRFHNRFIYVGVDISIYAILTGGRS